MPRKPHKYHFIYKTTCLITNRFYVGMHSTSNLNDGYMGSGLRIWRSLNKHGKENHVIEHLEFLDDRIQLKSRERELVNEDLLKDPMCMNLQPGGGGGLTTEAHRKAFQKAGSAAFLKRMKDPQYKSAFSDKVSANNKKNKTGFLSKPCDWNGKSHSEETKKKIGKANSISQSGSKNSQYGTCWVYREKENKKVSKSELDSYLKNGWIRGRKLK